MNMKTTVTLLLIVCLAAAITLAQAKDTDPVLDPSIASYINSQRTTWHATTQNKFRDYTVGDVMDILGTEISADYETPRKDLSHISDDSIPSSFDSRQRWGNCIHPIRNQEKCGSCWAFSLAETLGDRFCIATNGSVNVILSPEYLLQCNTANYGCRGGRLPTAWSFVKRNGIPTNKCDPYTSGNGHVRSDCPNQCPNGGRLRLYSASDYKHVGGGWFGNSVKDIQKEIMHNGPVQGAFTVYRDFMHYNGGVYKHTSGRKLGGHAIKIIGWGSQQGTPYWLVANSWGPQWGLNGFFKILRGQDECGIESQVYAGTPQTNRF